MAWGKPVAARKVVEPVKGQRAKHATPRFPIPQREEDDTKHSQRMKAAEAPKKRHRRTKAQIAIDRANELLEKMDEARKKPRARRRTKAEMEAARAGITSSNDSPIVHDDYTRQEVLARADKAFVEKEEPVTENFKAEMKYRKMKSNKGWSSDTLVMMLEEWIGKNELWPLLLKNFGAKR